MEREEQIDVRGLLQDQPLHWYDFICPFCYVGQHRSNILEKQGLHVTELPFQAHPEIPASGMAMGPRTGPMYQLLEREAKEAGLVINWPPWLPNTRYALAVTEWVRRHQPELFPSLQHDLFQAHFVNGEDLGSKDLVHRYVKENGINLDEARRAIDDGSAYKAVEDSEELARSLGASGTPAWLINDELIVGLRPAVEFTAFAEMQRRSRAGKDEEMQCKI